MIKIDRVRRAVGVSPGTTTFVLNGDATCPADRMRGDPGMAVDLSWMLQPSTANMVRVPIVPVPMSTLPKIPAPVPAPTVPTPAKVVLDPTASKVILPTPLPTPIVDPIYEKATLMPMPIPTTSKTAIGPVPEAIDKIVTAVKRMLTPASVKAKDKGLGLVLSPYGDISPEMYSEISATHQNYRNHCGPFDPQFNTSGEAGYYYDSPLGGAIKTTIGPRGFAGNMPTDFQVARAIGYMPVVNSWVPFKEATWTMAPWVPPHGGGAYTTIGPPLRGARRQRGWLDAIKSSLLGAADGALDVDAALPDIATTASVTEYNAGRAAVDELRRHQDRVFFLSVVSTAAVAGGFLLNVIKDRREKHNAAKKSKTTYDTATVPVAGARRRRKRSR